jgi:hypothetical protein
MNLSQLLYVYHTLCMHCTDPIISKYVENVPVGCNVQWRRVVLTLIQDDPFSNPDR